MNATEQLTYLYRRQLGKVGIDSTREWFEEQLSPTHAFRGSELLSTALAINGAAVALGQVTQQEYNESRRSEASCYTRPGDEASELERLGTVVGSRGGHVKVSSTHTTHRGARGRGGRHTVTLRCHYYSTTSSWVKLLSVPKSSSSKLYVTAAVQV